MPKIQIRRDTSANWKSVNPTLLSGEFALETDTKNIKVGDGVSSYNSLPYVKNNAWQKPASWIDLRPCAVHNSVYFLVGHSADYSTYPEFSVYAQIQNSGTYDVYVDGIKQATTASGTATTLNWQTLALTSGYDVTYPAALRTHIVRVTPSSSSNTISQIRLNSNSSVNQGVLWAHFAIGNMDSINLRAFCGEEVSAYKCPVLEAVTSTSGTIAGGQFMFMECTNLISIPDVTKGYAQNSLNGAFRHTALEKIHFKNCDLDCGYFTFASSDKLKKITSENSVLKMIYNNVFSRCASLETLEIPFTFGSRTYCRNLFQETGKLKGPIFLDASDGTALTYISLGGSVDYPLYGIKGVVVSPSAPFNYGTEPQLDVSYTGLDRSALVTLFNSMPYNVGYSTVGSPTITSAGVASGFSADDYIYISNLYTPSTITEFEMAIKFTVPNDIGNGSWLCGFNSTPTGMTNLQAGARIRTQAFDWWLFRKSDGTFQSYPVDYMFSSHTGETFTAKIVTDLSTVSVYVYDNTGAQVATSTFTSQSLVSDISSNIQIGKAMNNEVFVSSIDLSGTYVKLNNLTWFYGQPNMTKRCSIVGCAGTDSLDSTDKAIAENKGWSLTTAA